MNSPDKADLLDEIGVLDDHQLFLETGLLPLEQGGYHVHKFSAPEDLLEHAGQSKCTTVYFIDHDLGLAENGYDIVRTLRNSRPDGLLLPIVYLTGRETPDGYLAQEASDPYSSPSCYLNKRELIKADLVGLVARLLVRYRESLVQADDQAVSRAVTGLSELPNDFLWER